MLSRANGTPLIAAAIVVGCLAIAGAIYFGRERPAVTPVPARAAAPLDAAVAAVQSGASLDERVTLEVAAVLESQRALLVSRCWPRERPGPTMATSRHLFSISVDTEGREVGRGISDIRGESREDVSRCLRGISDATVRVSPPGRPVSVLVTMTLP